MFEGLPMASPLTEVQEEVNLFGLRVDTIEAVMNMTQDRGLTSSASAAPNNLASMMQKLQKSSKHGGFLDALSAMDLDALKMYIAVINAFKESIRTKWDMLVGQGSPFKYMQMWLDPNQNACACTKASADNLSVRNGYKMQNNNDTQMFVRDLMDVGFHLPTLVQALSDPYNALCPADCERFEKSRKSHNGSKFKGLTWQEYLVTHKNIAFSHIQAEVQVPYQFFMSLKNDSPMKVLPLLLSEVPGSSGQTYANILQKILAKERTLTNLQLPSNLDAIGTNLGEENILNLISNAGAADVIKVVGTLLNKVGSKLESQGGEKTDLLKLLETLKGQVAKLHETAEMLHLTVTTAEGMRMVRDIKSQLMNVMRGISRVTHSSSSSLGDIAPMSGMTSLWVSSASASGGLLQPVDASTLQAEVKPQSARIAMYRDMLKQHISQVANSTFLKDLDTTRTNTIKMIEALVQTSTDPNCNRPAVRESVVSALKTYVRNVIRIVKRYEKKHSEFVVWSNRRPLEYMIKWASVIPDDEALLKDVPEQQRQEVKTLTTDKDRQAIQEYLADMVKVAKMTDAAYLNAEQKALGIFTNGSYISILNEDETLLEQVQKQVDKLESLLLQSRLTVRRLYSPTGFSISDILKDKTFAVLYSLKVLRGLLLWAALGLAKSIFMPYYNTAVYANNKSPPHPLYFVLVFLGIDLALNIGIILILMLLRHIFQYTDSGFPIDQHVMHAIWTDYVLSMLLIAVLAMVIAAVIRRKKYFRYRFEGDRGIRAMSSMILWVSVAVLLIPFFRFMDG